MPNDKDNSEDILSIPELEEQLIQDAEESNSADLLQEMEKELAKTELAGVVQDFYSRAKDARNRTEHKWLQAYRDVRGEYNPRQKALIAKQQVNQPLASSAFVKITKTKAQQAYGQITEVISADNTFPIGIQPTPVPEGAADIAHLVPEDSVEAQMLEDPIGFAGDGREIAPGATENSILGGVKEALGNLLNGKKAVKGPSNDPKHVELTPAAKSAAEMQKLIQDQLAENTAEESLRNAAWECVHLGTGVLKGPMTSEKRTDKWVEEEVGLDENGEPIIEMVYQPSVKLFPEIASPSVWNIYPDPKATNMENAEGLVERHLVGRAELRSWKSKPGFDRAVIDLILETNPEYTQEFWEEELTDSHTNVSTDRYEILEYWGYVDERIAERLGLEFNQDYSLQINTFACNGKILKVVINPFIPQNIPYYLVPYEEVMYQVWGVGLPENNKDSQQLMNAHWRAAIDNLNLAGNVVLEVNKDSLAPGQNMSLYPGKMFHTTGAVGQSIFPIRFNDTSQSHMLAYDRARQLSDETSGILSFGQGSAALPSGIRTSSQTSMLLQGSAQTIKTVVKNFDHYLFEPLGRAIFAWNMQFNDDLPKIRGDLDIVAKGTSSLVQKEVMSQRLISFSQIAGSNPVMAPLVDFEYILQEFAKSLSLDPDKVINDPDKARLQAELMQTLNGGAGNVPGQQPSTETQSGNDGQAVGDTAGVPSGTGDLSGQDSSGGTIGAGGVPQPGETGFSAPA